MRLRTAGESGIQAIRRYHTPNTLLGRVLLGLGYSVASAAIATVVPEHAAVAGTPVATPGLHYSDLVRYTDDVAFRFDSCRITQEPVMGRHYKDGIGLNNRQSMQLTLETTRNSTGSRAEALLAHDHRVSWESRPMGFLVDRSSGRPRLDHLDTLSEISTVEKPVSTVSLAPKVPVEPEQAAHDPRRVTVGAQLAIFANTNAWTVDFEQRREHHAGTIVFCGTLAVGRDNANQLVWKLDPAAPEFRDDMKIQDCALVPIPGGGANSYQTRCH